MYSFGHFVIINKRGRERARVHYARTVRASPSIHGCLRIRLTAVSRGNPAPVKQGLTLVPVQLNLSSSVHRVTRLNPECVLELLKLSSTVNECKPLP